MSYIDVGALDFNQVDSSFRKEALKKIIEWNSPKSLKLNYQISPSSI
jgi:hypothetical protein